MSSFRTDLERENLEAHVELEAERHTFLEGRVKSLESSMHEQEKKMEQVEKNLTKAIEQMGKDFNKLIIGTAGAIIAGLASAVFTYISK